MPKVRIPDDWIACSLGCLHFRLPPDLAVSEMTTYRKEDIIVFHNSSYTIIVKVATMDNSSMNMLNLASSFIPITEKTLTLPRLRLKCSESGADCFRWSKHPKQIAQNSFFVNLRPLFIDDTTEKTEIFFYDNIDRITLFCQKRAMIDWQSITGTDTGYIVVVDRSVNNKINPDFVRRICQSIKIESQMDVCEKR